MTPVPTSTTFGLRRLVLALGILTALGLPASTWAQGKKNPASKMYVSDVGGEALIDTGDAIHDITRRSVYLAEGTVIETKALGEGKIQDTFSTMVYSNGTGAFFGADTRVELRQFVQEPFTPNRNDIDVEPSISRTQAFVARGEVGLCNSRQVAGSSMSYGTPHGSISIQGKRLVIETTNEMTRISMLDGQSIVKAGDMDLGGHTLNAGEQAIIRPGGPGQPNRIEVVKIADQDLPALESKVSKACHARTTVYFDIRDQDLSESAEGAALNAVTTDGSGGPVTAFDDVTEGRGSSPPPREFVPVEVVPVKLPVEHTLSAHSMPDPTN